MTKLYTLTAHTAHRVNVLNLVPYHIVGYSPERWFGQCRGMVRTEHPWLASRSGDLDLMANERFGCGLRSVKWSQHRDWLTEIVEMASANSQDLFFGVHHDYAELETLKDFFKDDLMVIALSYTLSDYDYLINDLAKTHVFSLKTGAVTPNDLDEENLKSKNTEQMVEYYKTVFDSTNYIPKSFNYPGNYEIPFSDYFDQAKMEEHFCNIGFPTSNNSLSLYHNWYALQR